MRQTRPITASSDHAHVYIRHGGSASIWVPRCPNTQVAEAALHLLDLRVDDALIELLLGLPDEHFLYAGPMGGAMVIHVRLDALTRRAQQMTLTADGTLA